jgi:hypothetical protein
VNSQDETDLINKCLCCDMCYTEQCRKCVVPHLVYRHLRDDKKYDVTFEQVFQDLCTPKDFPEEDDDRE